MTGILLPIDLGEENVIQVFNGGMCLLHISMYVYAPQITGYSYTLMMIA